LNQDNWDDDLRATTKGNFDKADKDIISQRKILTARTNRTSSGTSGLFKSFTAFSDCSSGNPVSFDFGLKHSSVKENGHKDEETEYLEHLQTLNQSLLDWITKHIKEDPFCILSPVFSDYDKHLSGINSKFPKQSLVGAVSLPEKKEASSHLIAKTSEVIETPVKSAPNPVFFFGNSIPKPTPISSGSSTDSTDKKPIFSFGLPPITTTSTNFTQSLFQFPSVSSFSQKPVNLDPKQNTSNQQGDDDGVNYSTKRIIGYFQLLISFFYPQNSNFLGNILLNILVTKDVPIKQQKNNLTLVCIPSPPLPSQAKSSLTNEEDNGQPKPVPMLIRVKTEEGATELLSQMDLHRGVSTKS
ncbi:nuclear pore complex protein Nup50, partial [Schistosoma bovis]